MYTLKTREKLWNVIKLNFLPFLFLFLLVCCVFRFVWILASYSMCNFSLFAEQSSFISVASQFTSCSPSNAHKLHFPWSLFIRPLFLSIIFLYFYWTRFNSISIETNIKSNKLLKKKRKKTQAERKRRKENHRLTIIRIVLMANTHNHILAKKKSRRNAREWQKE